MIPIDRVRKAQKTTPIIAAVVTLVALTGCTSMGIGPKKLVDTHQGYNDAVTQYNTYREVFPPVVVANSFGFREAQLFEIEDSAEKQAPKVEF